MDRFKSFQGPIALTLTIPVDVNTFGGISLIASELNKVDTQRERFRLPVSAIGLHRKGGYRLLSFEVRSPPSASLLADPTWLAVYLALLGLGVSCLQLIGSYPSIKSGAKELAHDIDRLKELVTSHARTSIEAIRGFSDAQGSDLMIGIRLYLDEALDSTEAAEASILRAARFASVLTRGGGNRVPDLRIGRF